MQCFGSTTIKSDTIKLLNDDPVNGFLKMFHLINKKTTGEEKLRAKVNFNKNDNITFIKI